MNDAVEHAEHANEHVRQRVRCVGGWGLAGVRLAG